MICNKCNRSLPEDSEFCQYCGNKIEKVEAVEDNTITGNSAEPSEKLNGFDMTSDDALSAIFKFQAKATIDAMQANSDSQLNYEYDKDFGLVPEKPIFTLATKSVDGEIEYLEQLITESGEKITYSRRGSTSAEGVYGMIDIYDTFLPSGEFYKTIYINMYGAKASTSIPYGFCYANQPEKAQTISSKKTPRSRKCIKIKKSHLIISIIIAIFTVFSVLMVCLILPSYKWYDADGTLLYKESKLHYKLSDDYELPEDTEKWNYIRWEYGYSLGYGKNTRIAYREPQTSYFVGNVFQIVVKDLGGTPIATGSAFVFNEEGWFITNAHVMKDAYYAQAIFNISNQLTGDSFTYLDINTGAYYHAEKDIYIGKIDNYSNIKTYYKPIAIEANYEIGETTYSLGYPDSVTELVANQGTVTETWSNIYEKLYSGNKYICSSSYIAPGSSGGILVNENLDVIGITTMGTTNKYDEFISGASISAFNFENILQNINSKDLISLQDRFHSDKKTYIKFFNNAKKDYESDEAEKIVLSDGTISYKYTWYGEGVNDDDEAYSYTEALSVCADGFISLETEYYWGTGGHRSIKLYGYYNHKTGLSDFAFEFRYEWQNNSYYTVKCDKINYSTTVSLSLNKCVTGGSFTPSNDNITYAKEQFNYLYEWLDEML